MAVGILSHRRNDEHALVFIPHPRRVALPREWQRSLTDHGRYRVHRARPDMSSRFLASGPTATLQYLLFAATEDGHARQHALKLF